MSRKNKNPQITFHNPFKDRSPIQRRRASDYILLTLLSFAFSVSATRLLLDITGYPQLGGGNIHIAHVLWGGLLLFIGALLPIVYVNEWAILASSLLTGFGVGLFIDEVGKFITQNNDYFYPTAAPIVYVFFLLTVLLFSRVKTKRDKTTRSDMYEVLERLVEVLDQDLSLYERAEMMKILEKIDDRNDNHELAALAKTLHEFLIEHPEISKSQEPNFLDKLRIFSMRVERKWLSKSQTRRWCVIGLFAWGIWAVLSPVIFFTATNTPAEMQVFVEELISNHLVRNASGLNWFEAKVLLEGSMGALSIVSGVLLLTRFEKAGTWLGLMNILLTLTVVNLLVFYFSQFSTIISAAFQFLLLVLLLRYQRKFLKDKNQVRLPPNLK